MGKTGRSPKKQSNKPRLCKKEFKKPHDNIVNKIVNIDKDAVKPKEFLASLGLAKINYDIKIDPNVVDKYTNDTVVLLPGPVITPAESPETKKRRIEEENMIIARQCRLHPANSKYNQGPVVNPPLISPGRVVGYTPAGQRHEVDLNFERPTWFNSEYARMQFDDATKINVSRMIHDLETGMFLPDCLDGNVERRHFAEKSLVVKDATEHFQKCLQRSQNFEEEEYISFLDSERQLIELNQFAVVKFQDFPRELAKKLHNAITLKLTPLMFKKNPIIVETLDKLSRDYNCHEVARPARSLLLKIKGLFDVPKSQTFQEYFASEVERLKEITKNMNGFDTLMIVREPVDKPREE